MIASHFPERPNRLTRVRAGLTIGGTVKGDPVKEIVKVAYENGINMFDTAEAYSNGESERELCVPTTLPEDSCRLTCFSSPTAVVSSRSSACDGAT